MLAVPQLLGLMKFFSILFAGSANGAPVATGEAASFLHITDIHIDPIYHEGTDPATFCHRPNSAAAKNIAGKFGTLKSECDSPVPLVDATFDFLKQDAETQRVGFIVFTGDAARHDRDSASPRTEDDALAEFRQVVGYFGKAYDLSKVTVFPTIGNNDVFHHNSETQTMSPSPLLTNLTKIWAPFRLHLDTDPDFQRGGWYIRDSPDTTSNLSILSLNTMWFYNFNNGAPDCDVATAPGNQMMAWMDRELTDLQTRGRKAIVIGHIPPKDGINAVAYKPTCYEKFLKLVGKHSDVINLSLFGHINYDQLQFLTHDTASGAYTLTAINSTTLPQEANPLKAPATSSIVHVMQTAPSIIPLYNPSARVYYYARVSGQRGAAGTILDYVQLYSDLNKDNSAGKVTWDREYKAVGAYGVPDLSAASMATIVKGLYEKNSKTFPLYAKYFTASA
ncbi:Endopolyphosphatase [Phlyctochytrium bullatum]|nr:Endopolyphosphatase [Phlyctochytrium bullatum]